ncbi:DUF2812 domain-containing protein [Clostridium estertheticum]|uniref:DUF2812 domain-containing protein n=1 Tax=Clostridium estertheticum TaxID=238834 RepID=UPI0013E9244C|nr:DUF2812 domain-containing protein [Clostridium estertheticum]MBZ9687255.1 DUF2812 domain-containing protein [Clostridium estertheticum]
MEKKNRYIMNMGLAFDEDRAMKKLCLMAKEGWILEKMSLFRYKLAKSQPKEIVYSMDYKKLGQNTDEYFELFQRSGWEHMCSYGDFHFFTAPPETIPIYTEKENYLSKYESSKQSYKQTAIISVVLLIIVNMIEFVLGSRIEGPIIRNILVVIGTILVAIAVPSLMVSVAYYIKEKRILKNGSKINQ